MRFNEVDFSELILLRQPTTKSSKNQFGKPKCNEVSVKSLLADPSVARVQRGRAFFSAEKKRRSFLTAENRIGAVVFTYFNINNCEADNSLVVSRGNSVVFGSFYKKKIVKGGRWVGVSVFSNQGEKTVKQ